MYKLNQIQDRIYIPNRNQCAERLIVEANAIKWVGLGDFHKVREISLRLLYTWRAANTVSDSLAKAGVLRYFNVYWRVIARLTFFVPFFFFIGFIFYPNGENFL